MATLNEAGWKSLQRLVEKLGLQDKAVQRIVLDIPIRGVATMYVQCLPNVDQVDAIADTLVDLKTGHEVGAVQTQKVSSIAIKPDMTIERK